MGTNIPFFRLLTSDDTKLIDQMGHRILEQIGIRIYDSAFLGILEVAGADVNYESQRVCFSGNWLDEVLAQAPSHFTLYSRDGHNDVHFGKDKIYFANGGRVFRLLDASTGDYHYTMLRDIAHTATLVHYLENIDFYIIACQAHGLGPQSYHLNDFYHAFNNTTKHVMGGCDSQEGARQMWELACLIAGGPDKLADRPFVSVITNPVSPLTIEAKTLDILQFCVRHSIPVTCAPAPIAGATSPASLAGTLSQMHAEALAGVAITQILAPGAKVLYGAVPTNMDLRNMEFTMGSVEAAMMNACAVQLAKMYNLPIYTSAGITESKTSDIQAGFEKTLSNLLVAMAGADCVHLAAGMLDSGNSISYEQYVIDNEIIGGIKRVLSGIKVSENVMGFDVINKVGPGGHFMIEDHTIENMMDEFFYPKLCIRSNFDIWKEHRCPSMLTRAKEVVIDILGKTEEGLLSPGLVSEIKRTFPGIQEIA